MASCKGGEGAGRLRVKGRPRVASCKGGAQGGFV